MQEPTLADVVARLERLEAAIETLTGLVRGNAAPETSGAEPRPAPRAASAPVAPAAVATASIVPSAAPSGPAPLTTGPGAPPAAPMKSTSWTKPVAVPKPVSEGEPVEAAAEGPPIEVDVPGPEAQLEDILFLLFKMSLSAREDDAWPVLTALTHPKSLAGPRTLDHLKAFNWRKLRRGIDRYLVDRDPWSFRVDRMEPAEVGPDVDTVKIFLCQEGASPAPITLRRDEGADGAWRIGQISL